MSGYRWTAEQDRIMLEMIAQGETHQCIADRLSVQRRAVSRRLGTLKLAKPRAKRTANNDDTQSTDAFSRMIRNGTTKLFIALQEAGYVREAA